MTHVMTADEQINERSALPQPACQAESAILSDCRAARIGEVTAFAQCLVEGDASCPHRFVISAFYYCVHPQREAIIGRTVAADGSSGQ
jgi:hypothetical protein